MMCTYRLQWLKNFNKNTPFTKLNCEIEEEEISKDIY